MYVIDTIRLGWPCPAPDLSGRLPDDAAPAWRVWHMGESADGARPVRMTLNGERVQLTWHSRPPVGLDRDIDVDEQDGYMIAQTSLPRLQYGSNYLELQPDDMYTAIDTLLGHAAKGARQRQPEQSQVNISRIDLTRNRQLEDAAAVRHQITTLADAGRALMPGRWQMAMHKSAALGGALTVVWRQKHRSLMIYDKQAESKELAAAGIARYEIRHLSKSVKRHLQLRRLPSLTPEIAERKLQEYLAQVPVFERSETLSDRVLQACMQLYGERKGRTTALRLLGYLSGADKGEWDRLPYSTQARYRAQIRAVSTHIGQPLEGDA